MGMGNPDLATPDPIVDKLVEAARNPRNHRYSASKGIPNLRLEISKWYARRYNVEIDPEAEAIVTIGAKEGFSHLVLALVEPGDKVIVPDPSYPIHSFAATIAGCQLIKLPINNSPEEMMEELRRLELHALGAAPNCWCFRSRTIQRRPASKLTFLKKPSRWRANAAI